MEVRQCEKFAAKGATAGSVGITRGEISVSGHQVGRHLVECQCLKRMLNRTEKKKRKKILGIQPFEV